MKFIFFGRKAAAPRAQICIKKSENGLERHKMGYKTVGRGSEVYTKINCCEKSCATKNIF